MRSALILALGFVLLVVESTLSGLFGLGVLLPNVIVPIVVYLGMAPDVKLGRGSMLAFALGLLQDSFCGSAMGLWTFVAVALFLVARGAGWRLIMRGRGSQVLAAGAATTVAGGTVLALRLIFRQGQSALPPVDNWDYQALCVLVPGLTTGAVAPWMFLVVRRLETFRRRDEGMATA